MRKVLILLIMCSTAFAGIDEYEFISPKPGSAFNTRESTIIIREGSMLDASIVSQVNLSVTGSESGRVEGKMILSSDQKTLIFKPDHSFRPGEKVNVMLGEGALPGCDFTFTVAPFAETPNPYGIMKELRPPRPENAVGKSYAQPGDFPTLTSVIYDTAAIGEGKVFLAVASEVDTIGYYLMILNNDGSPFWYKKLADDYSYDFKVQTNGLMTYAHFFEHHSYTGGGNVTHMIMDTSFTVIDSVQMKNGYVAEAHDFQILDNGHCLLFGYYLTQVDMSQYVDGGHPAAMVSGGVVQELDADRNVIFQWRTWDYYDYADYPWNVSRSKGATVSAFHLNTINLDKDGHFFLATPRWVKKINRQAGEPIWHLGGDENEFSFVGVDSADGTSHFGGHAFYRLPNDNVLIYDNGGRRGGTSQVHEYSLDENMKTATWVWSYVPDTEIGAWHRGNAQRLDNGNTVIGWGGASGDAIPTFSEVNSAGDKVMELFFDNPEVESYRAFRFPLPSVNTGISVTHQILAVGNTYEFVDGDDDTGVTVEVNDLTGQGYNDMTVTTIPYGPLYPEFPQKAPQILPVRVEMETDGITTMNIDVIFNTATFGFSNPSVLTVYHRVFPGSGLFIPITPAYNPVKQELEITVSNGGEFIFGYPDLTEVAYSPILVTPQDSSSVNQDLPLIFEWSPCGFANTFDLQMAHDTTFQNLLLDTTGLIDAKLTFSGLLPDTGYCWRVRTNNQAGTSDWSRATFSTAAPFITVTTPNGGESWQVGMDYYIFWDDNIDEDVLIGLYNTSGLVKEIVTHPSIGAYEWEIPLDIDPGDDYLIRIESSTEGTLYDISDAAFALIDTVQSGIESSDLPIAFNLPQNYPNPFNPVTTLHYTLPASEDVLLKIYDIRGKEIEELFNGRQEQGYHSLVWEALNQPAGIYIARLTAGKFKKQIKMLLVK